MVGTALFLTISYALHPMSATAHVSYSHVSVVLFIYTSYIIIIVLKIGIASVQVAPLAAIVDP